MCLSALAPSDLSKPTVVPCSDGIADHWEKGLAMEAALGGGAAAADGAAGLDAPPPPQAQRHHSAGLPPRGPPPQRAISAALDAALAAAAGGVGVGREPGASQAFSSAAGLLPVGRTSSSVSAPGLLEAADAAAAGAAAAAGGEAAPALAAEAAAGQQAAPQPPWQSPARIPPVPPLPLSRLSSSGAGSVRSGGGEGGAAHEEHNLLPLTSAQAPAGLLPPQPQPALLSRGWSGGVGRRPPGLASLDTDGLTFESFGLESPDTITPGLQYARQVAQLFVEGRRRSGTLGMPPVLNAASTAGGSVAAASTADCTSSAASSVAGGSSKPSITAGGASSAPPSRLGLPGVRAAESCEGAEQAPHPPWVPPG